MTSALLASPDGRDGPRRRERKKGTQSKAKLRIWLIGPPHPSLLAYLRADDRVYLDLSPVPCLRKKELRSYSNLIRADLIMVIPETRSREETKQMQILRQATMDIIEIQSRKSSSHYCVLDHPKSMHWNREWSRNGRQRCVNTGKTVLG